MPFKYANEFVVTGTGEFPIDMLRYDRCSPVSQLDASHVISSFNGNLDEDKELSVRLIRFTEGKGKNYADNPTVDRWKSFGWQVSDIRWEKM